MKTLLICREAPFPPTTGAPLRLWQQVNLLNSLGAVYVFSVGAPSDMPPTPMITEWVHIDEGSYRTPAVPGVLRAFKILNPTQFPGVGDFADRKLNRKLREFINRVNPDLIVLSHWVNTLPSALRGSKRLIVDSHNIESKLWSDQTALTSFNKAIRYYRFSRRETQLSEAAATTWVTSELDKSFLKNMSKKPISVSVWPNAIDLEYYSFDEMKAAAATVDFGTSFPTLIFVGYMAYGPNHDAACMLISEILPNIRAQYPGVRTFIVGKSPRPELVALATSEANVFVTGTVADVRPYLALSDLVVVPLTVGGGTRLKLLEAFAAKVAVVSTSKGAEGIAVAGSQEVAIADTSDDITREILGLLRDDHRRALQVQRAFDLVKSQFSWHALTARLPGEVAAVIGR